MVAHQQRILHRSRRNDERLYQGRRQEQQQENRYGPLRDGSALWFDSRFLRLLLDWRNGLGNGNGGGTGFRSEERVRRILRNHCPYSTRFLPRFAPRFE